MRLATIDEKKASFSDTLQNCPSDDISDLIIDGFRMLPKEAPARRLKEAVAQPVLLAQQASIRRRVRTKIPFPYNLLCMGERFGVEASICALTRLTRGDKITRVLIPGCSLGCEDVQFWLRRGVKHLTGIDVYPLTKGWHQTLPQLHAQYGADIKFQQGSIESMPFPDGTFDVIASWAVLEHVRNLKSMACETARVLRPGGWAWHEFGPLYYTHSGDHGIGAFGPGCGYDHLLLEEEAYQCAIHDQSFLDTQPDPNMLFWACHDQFSYASATEYLTIFQHLFTVQFLVVKISEEGLAFRDNYPKKWQALLDAGIPEAELLIKSLGVILRKR